jgi:dCTP diphosphatase
MSDLKQLQELVVAFRDERDWKQFHTPKDLTIGLMLEVAELLEHFQRKSTKELDEYMQKNKEDVADELADVLWWVLLLAHDLDIELPTQFKKKLAKNAAKYPVSKAKGNRKKYTELQEEET